MPSSGMLRPVALVRTDVSEEHSASIIEVTRIGELETSLAVTSNQRMQHVSASSYANIPNFLILVTLMTEVLHSSETLVLTRATGHNIPEDSILHSHHRENLNSYIERPLPHSFWNVMPSCYYLTAPSGLFFFRFSDPF
jgi:hypothetical protein